MNPTSLWFFTPNNTFDQLGGLSFFLKCNLLPGKLAISLSNVISIVFFHGNCVLSMVSPHTKLSFGIMLVISLFFPLDGLIIT